jgi:hypothetical protein
VVAAAARRADAADVSASILRAVAGLALVMSACAAPVGVVRVDARTVQRNLTASAVSAACASTFTRNVLHEQDCFKLFEDQPEAALAKLHEIATTPGRGTWRELLALAELSFLHAQAAGSRAHFLAAAVYAWAYLFPEDGSAPPSPFDARVRVSADIYNRALTRVFASPETGTVELGGGELELPFGTLSVDFDPAGLRWLDDARGHLAGGRLSARLELHDAFDADSVTIAGRGVGAADRRAVSCRTCRRWDCSG